MINLKSLIVISAILAVCCAQRPVIYRKKHHHHHGLHHLHFLYYLTFLAVKLKIVFFLGTIFTISAVAAKIFGIIKLMDYMKRKDKDHHHEEKIVYVNPHEHHFDHGSWGGGPPEYASKDFSSYSPDFSVDHPPEDAYGQHERYSTIKNTHARKINSIYDYFSDIVRKIRSLNITDMALNEMGIKDENCKKKFVCEADFNSNQSVILRTGLDLLRDNSYQEYKPNVTISSIQDCSQLYESCKESR
ncbi:uncharacterized protein LOC115887915 [Sitophilus oryzae]|uniref:Uncharacterized protein LOC115887915 n=1 Tax=Sitophilus oryzae TaxID=7048 RepID=A0A6J2YH20_SITOR|nr:uncharacterized protein LOC115887915 [Sitophilus oryzae]